MRYIDALLRRHEIPYWAVCGTLIGAIRHRAVMPWDTDIDIEMTEADFQRFTALEPTIYADMGLSITQLRGRGHYKLNHTFDVFVDDKRPDARQGKPNLFPHKHEIHPLREFQFYDFKIYGPYKAKQYLTRAYGDEVFSTCRIWNNAMDIYFPKGVRQCRHEMPIQSTKHRIWTAVRKEAAFLA